MQYNFLNIFLDPKELLDQSKKKAEFNINPFLLENNHSQLEKIYEFYKSNINLLYVNGFLGTGKAEIVKYSTAFLSPEAIILKYNCFNSTILDDIFLSFFDDFKKLIAQNIISEPKVKSENFTQKINSFFSQIEKPFVIILDSFESILDENRQEILDFIFHLNSMAKIKIIIIGRTFEGKNFQNKTIERVSTFALEREIFEKYLKSEKVKYSHQTLDEFYKNTRGYFFFTTLSLQLMKNENLLLAEFLTKVKDSFLPFSTFLAKQVLSSVPAAERNLFWFLSLIRHPISIELLKQLKFYNEEKIDFLIENLIIVKENSELYIQDFIKEQADETISSHVAQKIRQYIVDLYLTQLPLKPSERNICISRQTMRKEIEFHKLFLPKHPKTAEAQVVDINYLSYSKVFDFTEKAKVEDEKPKGEDEKKAAAPHIDLTQRKNISINLENLPFQDKSKLQPNTQQIIHPQKKKEEEGEAPQIQEIITVQALIEQAKTAEERYNYPKAIELYQKSIQLKNDAIYQARLPYIYTKLSYAYEKVAEHENALRYYELVQNIYENTQEYAKANSIKYNRAKILFETFKIEKAKELFLQTAQSNESQRSLIVKSYLQLANIEEGLSNQDKAYEYYKNAINLSNESMDVETISELYFKYALVADDKNDIKTAIEYYTKCIDLSKNVKENKFLSSAYSNIATLYQEKNDIENAILNFTKAYEIDNLCNNFEGMYYSASKLASMLQRKQPDEAYKYFQSALDNAKLTKDAFYTVSASLAIGDYLYDRKKDEIALKHYLYALDLANNNFSKDNINKINIRINDIKFRLGVEKFEALSEKIEQIIREGDHE